MIIAGNSNVECFTKGELKLSAESERISVYWVGALTIEHFYTDHPAAQKIRELFAAESGWKFLSIGIHDIITLCHWASSDRMEEAFHKLLNLYQPVFLEFHALGKFAWLVFPQPLQQFSYPNLTSENVGEIARLFNQAVEAWCTQNGILVINPAAHILGADGQPLLHFLQADGMHLNSAGAQIYLDEIGHLTGEQVELVEQAHPFEPASELESFCSLLLTNLQIPWKAAPERAAFQQDLADYTSELLIKRGIEVDVDDQTDLVSSGLLDSLNLVDLYSHASQIMKMDIPFDVNLIELNTISKIADFLFAARMSEAAIAGNWELSQEDFVLSLRGDFANPQQKQALLDAEARIGGMSPEVYMAIEENLAIAGDGSACPYGIVFFWMALHQGHQHNIPAAASLLQQAAESGKRFRFDDPRVDHYRKNWVQAAGSTAISGAVSPQLELWNQPVNDSVLTMVTHKQKVETAASIAMPAPPEEHIPAPQAAAAQGAFRESALAHKWLDGLQGLEVGPSAHNPFGLRTRFVGMQQEGYAKEQLELTGRFVQLDVEAQAEDIPVVDESEDFVLSSHVIEHCPDLIRTLVEWFRIIKPGGYLFMIVPLRNAAPVDVGRPLTEWQHMVDDYVRAVDGETHEDVSMYGGGFGYCHYHVFDYDLMQEFIRRIFGERLQLVEGQPVDDKIGNGFTLVYRKNIPLSECFPWTLDEGVEIDVFSKPWPLPATSLPDSTNTPVFVVAANLVPFKNAEQRQRQDLCVASLYDLRQRGIIPLNICYEDELMTPVGWEVEPVLTNSAREVLGVDDKRKPFVSELFQLAAVWCERKGIEYFALSNSDIIFTTQLVDELRRLMAEGYDAVAVSRNEVERIDPVAGLVPGYLEVNGYDVFFCRVAWWKENRQLFKPYIFGARAWDDAYAAVMACHGKFHVLNVDGMCFHIKHATDWLGGPYAEFNLYLYNGIDKKYQDRYNSFIREVLQTDRRRLPAVMTDLLKKHFDLSREDYLSSYEKRALRYVNIGMVTYNRLEFTKQSIDSLLRHTDYPYVLTVIDNCSQDGTQEYLSDLHAKGIIGNLVLLDENVGVAKASNLAWGLEPDASYYLKLDNDIVFEKPRWLAGMVAVADRVPEIGVIGYNFEPLSYPLHEVHGVAIRVKANGNIGGACILIPQRTHERLGFWCEDYGLYGEEDADYGARIQLSGLFNAYMADENIGFHLPAGKAAVIDKISFEAKDGLEEVDDREYRLWKDEQRRLNMKGGRFEENVQAYLEKRKPLKICTSAMSGAWPATVRSDGKYVVSIIICCDDDHKFAQMHLNYINLLHGISFEIIRISDAQSLAEGYRRGIKQATGEILIFSPDNIESLTPDFKARLSEYLDKFSLADDQYNPEVVFGRSSILKTLLNSDVPSTYEPTALEGERSRVVQQESIVSRSKPRLRCVIYSADLPVAACAKIRLIDPLTRLKGDVEFVWALSLSNNDVGNPDQINALIDLDVLATADLVIIQRFFPLVGGFQHALKNILSAGKPIIYETDDSLTSLPDDNPHAKAAEKHRDAMLDFVRKCSAVTVSTKELSKEYLKYNPSVYVLPNLLDEKRWFRNLLSNVIQSDRIVIGYAGTITHVADLELIEDALERISQKYSDRVAFKFIGCATPRMMALPNAEMTNFKVSYDEYPDALRQLALDIAVAPLQDNAFNRCKSNIKWLEYSAVGIAGVYSDLSPYNECVEHMRTGMLANSDPESWVLALDYLVSNPDARHAMVKAAQDEIKAKYTLESGVHQYLDVYAEIIKSNPAKTSIDNDAIYREQQDVAAKAYQTWISKHSLQEIDAQLHAERLMLQWKSKPVFHFMMSLMEGEESLLANTIDSLSAQMYGQWTLTVVAKFPSPDPIFEELTVLQWVEIQQEESYSDGMNRALNAIQSDWVALIEPGLTFEQQLLLVCGDYTNIRPYWQLIYCDEDVLGSDKARSDPKFKPDLNLDLLRSMPYFGALCMVKRDALLKINGYSDFPHAENYDLAFRILDTYGESAIGHISDVLCHLPAEKVNYFSESAGKLALESHLARQNISAEITEGYQHGTFRINYRFETQPKVSVIIPTRDKLELLQPCIEDLLSKTNYPDFEVIVVDNQSEEPDIFDYYRNLTDRFGSRVRVLHYDHDFNYAAISNMAVAEANGEYVLFLNNDTRVIQAEWLERMVAHGQRQEVGIVGARLIFPDSNKIQHAGVLLGLNTIADHVFLGQLDLNDPGYMGRAHVDQDYSAVTAACMLVRKAIYQEVGGMDEKDLQVSYNDVDLCLKVREKGYKIVWTPYASLVHDSHSSLRDAKKDPEKLAQNLVKGKHERETMLLRWLPKLAEDPAYNRHLSLAAYDCRVESDIVIDWDVNFHDRPRILGIPLPGGSGFYRIISPFQALSEAAVAQTTVVQTAKMAITRVLNPVELERTHADTIVLHAPLDDSQIGALQDYKKYNSQMRIFMLDDLVTNPPLKSSFFKQSYRDAKPRLRKALSLSDRLIVTTQPLADACQSMIEDIRVIPNMLRRSQWEGVASKRRQGKKPRVGWAGAQQHQGDLALIIDVVKATSVEVDWIFFGMCLDELRPYVKEVHEFQLSHQDYIEKLASLNLDLAVAPLEMHPFNEAKSNLRLLEYGYLGWPVICTDIYPYQGAPVKRVPNETAAWIEAIRERVNNLDAAEYEGDTLRQWVQKNYMMEDHLTAWLSALTR